ncbi:uncharacterized protein MONBRDRAFT_4770, partial [Monosiga brevicollis MX1]
LVCLLAIVARWIGQQADINAAGVSYEVWALVLGILLANTFALPPWLKRAAKGEFFIKVGLVLLGLDIRKVGDLGGPGFLVSWVVTPIVVLVGYRVLAMSMLRMQDQRELALVLTCATSICGASAATAVHGCVGGSKEVLTVAIALVNLFTIPQMLGLPYLARAVGLSAGVSGAWFGGSVDATGAVVASSAVFDDLNDIDCDLVKVCALNTGSTVKIIQNIIIGPVCLAITAYWLGEQQKQDQAALDVETGSAGMGAAESAPPPEGKLRQLWKRFPKFILGFLFVSIIITIVNATASAPIQDTLGACVSASSRWWFSLGFAGIGLTTNFRELAQSLRGGKPVFLYLLVQAFDLLLTLAAAYLAFEVIS